MASYAIPSSLPDEVLVRLCRQGEADAFTLIYDRYRRRVLQTAHRIIRDPEDARDATQEIFLKAYLSLRQWNSDKARLSTWLYRLATNHAIDCWRSRRRRARTESADEMREDGSAFEFVADAIEAPDRELERKELRSQFDRCLSRLPELQRRMFMLRHYYGLSLAEIARREGRSLATVKGSLYRATHAVGRNLCRAARRARVWTSFPVKACQ